MILCCCLIFSLYCNCPFTSPNWDLVQHQVSQIKLLSTNKNHRTLDPEDGSFLELELATLQEVIALEPNWPEERVELKDNELSQMLQIANETSHKAQMTVDMGVRQGTSV